MNRQAMTLPTDAQRTKKAWMPAQVRRGVVEDLFGPEHADDTVVNADVSDGEDVRDPVLKEGEEREHHKEVEVKLDVAAREMDEDRGRAHHPEPDGGRLERAAGLLPAGEDGEERHDQRLAERVEHGSVAEHGVDAQLPVITEHGPDKRDQDRVEPGKSQEEAAPLAPDVLRQRAA